MNPFRYQGPVRPERLLGRRAELDILQRAAGDRVALRLAAPRRFGKTSLLDAHVAAMRETGHRAVRVDFSKVATVADAAARVAAAYGQLPADAARRASRWSTRLGVGGSLAGLSVSAQPASGRPGADEARAALLELLDVPASLHADDGGLTIVCLDEFQDLLVADDGLDGLVRSVIQHHGDSAAYVFAGSQPSLMRSLFSDQERPFYGQARPLDLPTLPLDETTNQIESALRGDGLEVPADLDLLVAFTHGHPQRTMLLAHHLYEILASGGDPHDAVAAALERAAAETRDAHQALWDGIGRSERLVLIAIADGNAPTGTRIAEEHRIARSTLQEAHSRLLADQRLLTAGPEGASRLLDPLLADWLRRR